MISDFSPLESVATTLMVLVPLLNETDLENEPSALTVTAPTSVPLTLIAMVVGLLVVSLVLPDTVTLLTLVFNPSEGAVTFRVGGTVSMVNVELATLDLLPS